MRIFFILSTVAVLLSLAPIENVQVEIKTEEHSCEGQSAWRAPACQSAWEPQVTAVFLGLATDVLEEDVPITLDGEKVHTSKQHITMRVSEPFIGVSEKSLKVTSGGDLCGLLF